MMVDGYITPACLLYRCGDREGNLQQCRALLEITEYDDEKGKLVLIETLSDDAVNDIIKAVSRANWDERNCSNCALFILGACPTHGYLTSNNRDLSHCYHRFTSELGNKRVNRRVIVRFARFCSMRASMHAMETRAAYAVGAAYAAGAAAGAAYAAHADAAAAAAYAAYAADAAHAAAAADAAAAARAAAYAAADAAAAARAAAYAAHAADEWWTCVRELWRLIEKFGDDAP